MRTYDILNAGRKHRFMAAGRIVSNSGRVFQPQNLPRSPDWFDEHVQEMTVAAFKADCEDLLWANISERCAFAVRGCLVAAEGHKFAIADLSNIEGRVVAWSAGEQWKLDAFKLYDRGEGPDLYKVTAGRILGKDPSEVTKAERQLPGKVSELFASYGGAVGAARTMGGPAMEAMSDEDILEIVRAWRAANPRIKRFWYDMEGAAKQAIENPGEAFFVGEAARFDVRRGPDGTQWLRMRLPSGRYLCYPRPAVDAEQCSRCSGAGTVGFEHNGEMKELKCPSCGGSGEQGSGRITYEGTNQYTRKWQRLDTYGGKIVENHTQAVARDVFMHGLRRAEEAGYAVVLRVHDELVCEVPDEPGYTHEALAAMMAENPGWTTGLPLAAAGFTSRRYRKD